MEDEIKRIGKIKDKEKQKKELAVLLGALAMAEFGMEAGFEMFKTINNFENVDSSN